MVTRIENIDDLIIWLDSVATLQTKNKNVALEKLTDSQIASLVSAQQVLEEIKTQFPDPFKQCRKCKVIYPETREWFDWNGQGRTGFRGVCKFCRNAIRREDRRKKRLLPKYTAEELEEINYHRELNGQPPLDIPVKRKPGRPKGSKSKKYPISQQPPAPGERW